MKQHWTCAVFNRVVLPLDLSRGPHQDKQMVRNHTEEKLMQAKTEAAGSAAAIVLGLMAAADPNKRGVFPAAIPDDVTERRPVGFHIDFTLNPGTGSWTGPVYAVPAGQRLVIDRLSTKVTGPAGQRAFVAIQSWSGSSGQYVEYYPPMQWTVCGPNTDQGLGTLAVQEWADPGSLIYISAQRLKADAGTMKAAITWTGYLMPLP